MKIRLRKAISGLGKLGEVVSVEAVQGHALCTAGRAEVVEHDAPGSGRGKKRRGVAPMVPEPEMEVSKED